jgi:integrase
MDGVSGAVGIASLAIQLASTVQKVSKFLRNARDAPKEVLRLLEILDQLHDTLDHVRQLNEQQSLILSLPGSPASITRAMENCKRQVKALEVFVNEAKTSFDHPHKLRRTWACTKVAGKRQDLDDIQCRLRDAETDLHFAISRNCLELQC